jgi:hypothetical protein
VPSLRLVADRDVVQAAKHLLVRTEIEAREMEEGKEIADVEEAAATSAVPADTGVDALEISLSFNRVRSGAWVR